MRGIEDLIRVSEKCKNMNKIRIKRGEIITNFIEKKTQFGVIIDGCADLVRYDINGDKVIIERMYRGDVYGELFHLSHNVNELFVEAKTGVSVLVFDYIDIDNKDESSYDNHDELKSILIDILIDKCVKQNTRISTLTQSSLRSKILYYFNNVSLRGIKKVFKMPFSYTDFADYLNVDRSSLSRELTSLEEDGFIIKNGKTIKILY